MDKKEQDFTDRAKRTLTKLVQDGQKVQVLGKITEDGQLVIDQDNLKELASKYPNTQMMFVALNSPFDPAPSADG